jgi:hypothetical protein
MNKLKLKRALRAATSCCIQHTGWPCGTCFFALSKRLTNKDWQALLLYRGDYKREDLDNLPRDIEKSLQKILNTAERKQ